MWPKETLQRDTLKASLKNFNIPAESWEQAAQDICLIRKGAAHYKAKRICEAERQRRERKAMLDYELS